MTLFELKDLTKRYGSRTVLALPSLRLDKGFIYSLQGPNGSGKTTLLEILGFLIPPSSGEIRYEERKIDFYRNDLTSLRREIVMVPQNPVLFTTSVYKNVELGPRIRGVAKGKRGRIVHECLDLVGMREFASAQAHKLSGGETQRIAIARALACSPKVILFDEPTSSVDVASQAAIEGIMRNINERKKISLVFTTHNPGQASRLSHRMVSLFEGRPVASAFGNIYKGVGRVDSQGKGVCILEEKITLRVNASVSGEVSLSLDPTKIRILTPSDGAPQENRLRGNIVRLADEGSQILLSVDVGVLLNILLPKTDAAERPLSLGQKVELYCPPEAVQVL
ncbi:MAG: ATP-binding cassette domain-containing protein [Deltaproteobacteria bacterium]|nr:ATP-binding cassette domain-containing protein [Deltaproteobacteria bacterium]